MKRVCLLLFLSALSWKSIRIDGIQVKGTWIRCGSEEFFISTTKLTESEAITYCKHLHMVSDLASLGEIQEHCMTMIDNHTYWIEKCHQNSCSTIKVTHNMDRKLQIATRGVPCSDLYAFICRPISEHSTLSRTTQSCIDGTTIPHGTQTPAIRTTTLTPSPTSPAAISSRTHTPGVTTTTRTPSSTSPAAIPSRKHTPVVTTTTRTPSPTSPSTTTAITDSMVNTEQREYIVNYELTSHQDAEVGCILKDNSGLITCGSVSDCFMTFDGLNLKNGTYWIGGNTDHKTGCLMFDANLRAILMSECGDKRSSICNGQTIRTRVDVLEMPTFKNLIKDMTVNKSKTFKASMKLRCQQDKRTSAKVVGSLGVFIMVAIGVFILLFDFINVIRYCKK